MQWRTACASAGIQRFPLLLQLLRVVYLQTSNKGHDSLTGLIFDIGGHERASLQEAAAAAMTPPS